MYNTGGLWSNPRQPGWSDMEWQIRNWLYFTWLSGDHIVEQHIHTLDKMLWMMKNVPPLKVTSNGGRTVRTQPEFGNIYDHFDSIYEWENGVRAFCQTRQWTGADVQIDTDTSDWAFGTKGVANIMNHRITGENVWRRRASPVNMYDAEHVAMYKAIRSGKPINNGDYMVKSTLMGIMGRMAAYTGKTIYWDRPKEGESPTPNGVGVPKTALFLMESKEDLTPPKYEFGPLATPQVAVPGKTKFV
jgi:predicted dehydrogenase